MPITFKMASAIVETAFTPLSCRCSHDLSSARIRIYDAATGEPRLLVAGIQMSGLGTAKAVSKLIGELRHELTVVSLYTSLHQPSRLNSD